MNDATTPLPHDVLDAVARDVMRTRSSRSLADMTQQRDDRHVSARMKIHIVCYEDLDAWILGKIARRLLEELRSMGMEASVGKEQNPAAEINHHIVYFDYLEQKATVETVMVTHIDNERELNKVLRQLIDVGVEMGICMSYEAVQRLAHFAVPREKLCFITPAHDGVMKPRKTLVGLTTRVYPDGCKRELLLQELAELVSPEEFRFAIMGSGWDNIVAGMRQRGFEVDYFDRFSYSAYCTLMPSLDYYLYLGRDEGSMGFLDALAAGVPTIVTRQGFHLDVPDGISYPFDDMSELQAVFSDIADLKRKRVQAVSTLTWSRYARQHLLVWEHLLCRMNGKQTPATLSRELSGLGFVTTP